MRAIFSGLIGLAMIGALPKNNENDEMKPAPALAINLAVTLATRYVTMTASR